ncbi:RlmE family RNA methyltransferase [Candidatus Venteria ishoeyi]|uniref:Ribosomal RNA large subunit methyltransferase E n=1 Tax=Candidatus Venteria ishoeyi TaxID=1899563 RepID=A0A1H6FAS6_9GAMM|nr:SAM-dependent methyltransferase [Candidatus Venteria ishoeyi]SEH06471.1 Ribosomal RNA large subunit methyltransferase E [Candidatus Venteria ishoeyi]
MSKGSSNRWRKRQDKDPYVKQAQKEGYRSRAVYKLAELDQRNRLFRPGMSIVDLGAAPGGWSQWVQQRLHDKVKIIALDILPMDALPDVIFIHGDFTQQRVFEQLQQVLAGNPVDLVMSDMAPNISGMKAVDQPRAMLLAELARDAAYDLLNEGGVFLTKIFQGEGFDAYVRALRPHFQKVIIRKPKASRPQSREVYLVGIGYRGQ